MAKEIAIPAAPTTALSLPRWLAGLALGTVQWPGQATRTYLAGRSSLTLSQKAEAEAVKAELEQALDGAAGGAVAGQARSVILAKMILGAGGAALSERVAEAKAENYRDAVGDMPAWAISEAVKRWNRGEWGEQRYAFAPEPALLRTLVDRVLTPYRDALARVATALNAVTIERAMDPAPIERPAITGPGGRQVRIAMRKL